MDGTQTTSARAEDRILELEAMLATERAALAAERDLVAKLTVERDHLRASHERLRLELELLRRRIFVAKAERVDTAQLELELAQKLARRPCWDRSRPCSGRPGRCVRAPATREDRRLPGGARRPAFVRGGFHTEAWRGPARIREERLRELPGVRRHPKRSRAVSLQELRSGQTRGSVVPRTWILCLVPRPAHGGAIGACPRLRRRQAGLSVVVGERIRPRPSLRLMGRSCASAGLRSCPASRRTSRKTWANGTTTYCILPAHWGQVRTSTPRPRPPTGPRPHRPELHGRPTRTAAHQDRLATGQQCAQAGTMMRKIPYGRPSDSAARLSRQANRGGRVQAGAEIQARPTSRTPPMRRILPTRRSTCWPGSPRSTGSMRAIYWRPVLGAVGRQVGLPRPAEAIGGHQGTRDRALAGEQSPMPT
jgi:hypothetical protein